MKLLILPTVMIASMIFSINAAAQNTMDSTRLFKSLQYALQLKMVEPTPVISFNTKPMLDQRSAFYLYQQEGMYEQYNLGQNNSYMSRPYKAHFPVAGWSFIHNPNHPLPKDSFNPHGVDNIGSAIVNGLINGVLLGNSYR